MQDQPILNKLNLNRKKVTIIVAAVVVLAIVITAAIMGSKYLGNSGSTATLKAAGDNLKSQAIEAQKNNDETRAIELLEDAKDKYEASGDTNNKVDTEALIYVMQHSN